MPRLEDSSLTTPARKFKKRRAWIPIDDASHMDDIPSTKKGHIADTSEADEFAQAKPRQKHNKIETKQKLDYNKKITNKKHDMDKGTGGGEHLENQPKLDLQSFFVFLLHERSAIIDYENDTRSIILGLSSTQREVFWRVAIRCINRNTLNTGPLEIADFFSSMRTSIDVARTSLFRLVKKKLLQREKGKLGRNGFAIIAIPKPMFDIASSIFEKFQKKSRLKQN